MEKDYDNHLLSLNKQQLLVEYNSLSRTTYDWVVRSDEEIKEVKEKIWKVLLLLHKQ